MRGSKTNKRKVALFQRIGDLDWTTVWCAGSEQSDDEADDDQPEGWVRVSQYITVDFPEANQDTVIEKQLAQLDKAEQRAREELQQRLNQIQDVRQKLLSLTFKPAA